MVAIPALFNGKKEATAGMTAPPQGLSLVEVYY
jgi:tRNA U38,U39,U40 pseudouridine synthase TruA